MDARASACFVLVEQRDPGRIVGYYIRGRTLKRRLLRRMALHHLDNLDAKLHSFEQLMRDDPNVDSGWTNYHASLGRKLFKGGAENSQRSSQPR